MFRILYLTRHGETDWNREYRWQGHTDIPLNAAGRAQATELAERLRAIAPTWIYSSDLVRARETGEIVAARLGACFLGVDSRLRERSFGLFEGLTRAECEARHPEHWQRYAADASCLPPGAEAGDGVMARMQAALLGAGHDRSGAVLVVSHGSAIRTVVTAATGRSCPPIANTAVFRLLLDQERGAVVSAEPVE